MKRVARVAGKGEAARGAGPRGAGRRGTKRTQTAAPGRQGGAGASGNRGEGGGTTPRRRKAAEKAAEKAAPQPATPDAVLAERAQEQIDRARQELQALETRGVSLLEGFAEAERAMTAARAEAEAAAERFQELLRSARDAEREAREAAEGLEESRDSFDAARQEADAARARAAEELAGLSDLLERLREETRKAREEVEGLRRLAAEAPRPFEAAPADDPVAGLVAGPAVEAAQPAEGAADRLRGYLNDAWAVENGLVESIQQVVEGVTEPEVRSALEEARNLSHRHQEAVAARLRALGREPSGGRGVLSQMLSRIWDAFHRPRDEQDRLYQGVMQGLGSLHFAMALYQALGAYAGAAGDGETAVLAGDLLGEKLEATHRLRPLLPTAAAQAAGSAG